MHLLIGYIVIRLAFGDSGTADQSGALTALASQPGGRGRCGVAAVTLAALAAWRAVEAFVGKIRRGGAVRAGPAKDRVASRVAYLALAFTAFQFALAAAESRAPSRTSASSARLMQSAGGKTVLVVAAW